MYTYNDIRNEYQMHTGREYPTSSEIDFILRQILDIKNAIEDLKLGSWANK